MKNEKYIYWAVAGGSVLICAFVFFSGESEPEVAKGKVTFGQVDTLRKETQVKQTIEQNKVSVENYKKAPALSNQYRPVSEEQASEGIKLESSMNHAAKDIEEVDGSSAQPTNMLESQINKKLLSEQRSAQMSVVQKKQFIADYKRKALAQGYKVELNDQLVVTKVQKVEPTAGKGPASVTKDVDVEIIEYDDESAEY